MIGHSPVLWPNWSICRNRRHPLWRVFLLSSQLDMDRLDYLRRDSLFTGSDYGHFLTGID